MLLRRGLILNQNHILSSIRPGFINMSTLGDALSQSDRDEKLQLANEQDGTQTPSKRSSASFRRIYNNPQSLHRKVLSEPHRISDTNLLETNGHSIPKRTSEVTTVRSQPMDISNGERTKYKQRQIPEFWNALLMQYNVPERPLTQWDDVLDTFVRDFHGLIDCSLAVAGQYPPFCPTSNRFCDLADEIIQSRRDLYELQQSLIELLNAKWILKQASIYYEGNTSAGLRHACSTRLDIPSIALKELHNSRASILLYVKLIGRFYYRRHCLNKLEDIAEQIDHFSGSPEFKASEQDTYEAKVPQRTKVDPQKIDYFTTSGPDERKNRSISHMFFKSYSKLLASLHSTIESDVIDRVCRTKLIISAHEMRLSRQFLASTMYDARIYNRYRETWDSFQHAHHDHRSLGRSQVLNELRRRERNTLQKFVLSWSEMYAQYLILKTHQDLVGQFMMFDARKAYRAIIKPLDRTYHYIRDMLVPDTGDVPEIAHAIKQILRSLNGITRLWHEYLGFIPLAPSGRYEFGKFHPISLSVSMRHFENSIGELKRCIGDWRRAARGGPQSLERSERLGSRLGKVDFGAKARSEMQMQENGRPTDIENEGKEEEIFRINGPKTKPRFTLGKSIPLDEVDRHQDDGCRELRPELDDNLKSQVEQARPPIVLSQSTASDSFSFSRLKCLPQTALSRDTQSQSVSRSNLRMAAYHTSNNRRYSATAAATAAFEMTDSTKVIEEEVSDINPTDEHHAVSQLGYRIPSDRMRESMRTSRSSRSAYWQYTLYEGPKKERVIVHYCKSLETTERISKLFLKESIIGFDIEWKPAAAVKDGIRKNVATIQLASEERIALFHIARFAKGDRIEDLVAPSFKRIMESSSIAKVGVSVKSDCTRLRKFMNIDSRGLFELSHLYKLVKFASDDVKKINKKLVSLATQVEEHLMLPLYKDENVRASDWSEELNYEQIYYAASDSYAGFQLYHTLNNKRLSLTPTPPLPAHAELNLPIRLANGQTIAEYEDPVAEEPTPEPTDAPLPSTEKLAGDVLNLQIEDKSPPPHPSTSTQPSTPNSKAKPKSKPPDSSSSSSSSNTSLSSHPSILAANEWMKHYRASTNPGSLSSNDLSYPLLPSTTITSPTPNTRPKALPSHLRTFFLFHHHGLSIPDIASLLRSPPLLEKTVAGYVLEAVKVEGLKIEAGKRRECEGFLGAGRGEWWRER